MVVESDPHSVPLAEHLTGHEGIEDARAGQRQAEVEAEEPPVFHLLVELGTERRGVRIVGLGVYGGSGRRLDSSIGLDCSHLPPGRAVAQPFSMRVEVLLPPPPSPPLCLRSSFSPLLWPSTCFVLGARQRVSGLSGEERELRNTIAAAFPPSQPGLSASV